VIVQTTSSRRALCAGAAAGLVLTLTGVATGQKAFADTNGDALLTTVNLSDDPFDTTGPDVRTSGLGDITTTLGGVVRKITLTRDHGRTRVAVSMLTGRCQEPSWTRHGRSLTLHLKKSACAGGAASKTFVTTTAHTVSHVDVVG